MALSTHRVVQAVAGMMLILVLAGCGRGADPAAASAGVSSALQPDTAETELDWLEMLPASELAAYERGEGPPVDHQGDRAMPQFGTFTINPAVLERPVRLPGYVVPLANDAQGRLVEFLFVPYYGACIHVPPPPPNQIVHVRLAQAIESPDMYSPLFLSGTLRAERFDDALAGSAYTMASATLRPYAP